MFIKPTAVGAEEVAAASHQADRIWMDIQKSMHILEEMPNGL